MDSLSGITTFVRAAQTLSFVAAGRALGVSASAVGKSIAKLEATVGVRLFHRSTRRVSLTAEGSLFYERCCRILDDLRDAEAMLSRAALAPRGTLRVSLPTIGYRFLLPLLPEFATLYPEIELELDFNDRLVDVVEEGFDVVIRSGTLTDSRLRARQLGPFRFLLCAAPAYLNTHGVPARAADLENHRCLRYRAPSTGKLQEWEFKEEIGALDARLPTGLICNNMEALQAAAIGGLGIACMPDFLAREAIDSGALASVLDDCLGRHGQFSMLWPSSRELSPKLRVFVDFLGARLFAAEAAPGAGRAQRPDKRGGAAGPARAHTDDSKKQQSA
ncbi:LysR family transcriptional regulator [Janthinobacterium sp.]|uniref:LysR family transcriptional regulator n=1 Tax=Janthinobacterium sp. TaxID=1871054 RepID=UPI00293D641A|nr:LysR family transcriptional regulator [Janthinobacterium sp.]